MRDKKDYDREYFVDWHRVVNPERIQVLSFNLNYLLQLKKDIKRILDVGCGLGEFLAICEKRGMETHGVEISSFAINKAKKRIKAKLEQLDASRQKLPFKNNFFDAVTIFDVLEHLKTSRLILDQTFRVLKKGGILFCTTPNDQGRLGRFLERFMPDDSTHINKKTPTGWTKELKLSGFDDIKIKGVIFHGLPPVPTLRKKMKRLNFPATIRPIFFPIKSLCGTLYITARK